MRKNRIIREAKQTDITDIMQVMEAAKKIMRQSGNMYQWGDGLMKYNHIMQHNILKHGFTYCGIIHLANGDERRAYQKLSLCQK